MRASALLPRFGRVLAVLALGGHDLILYIGNSPVLLLSLWNLMKASVGWGRFFAWVGQAAAAKVPTLLRVDQAFCSVPCYASTFFTAHVTVSGSTFLVHSGPYPVPGSMSNR